MSSGLILRASYLAEGRGAYFHGLSSGTTFIIPFILRRLFPLLEKTGSDKLTGPCQIYHNPNTSLSRGYLLSSLMRMVAMRRMRQILLIIELSNTSNGSSFNLVSTHLQIMRSGCPMYNQLGVTVRASHFGPIPRLSSHRGSVVSQRLVGSMPLPCQPLGLNFSDGRQLHLLCAHLLSTEGWLFP